MKPLTALLLSLCLHTALHGCDTLSAAHFPSLAHSACTSTVATHIAAALTQQLHKNSAALQLADNIMAQYEKHLEKLQQQESQLQAWKTGLNQLLREARRPSECKEKKPKSLADTVTKLIQQQRVVQQKLKQLNIAIGSLQKKYNATCAEQKQLEAHNYNCIKNLSTLTLDQLDMFTL